MISMIRTEKYQASNGSLPRGRARWAFLVDGEPIFIEGQLTFAQAKAKILAMANEKGRNWKKIEVAP